MNKENASKLWKIIQEAGDYLKGQLPDHPNHPKGRNPYAHVAICVKSKFQKSYKDIEDEKFQEVLDYIEVGDTVFWKSTTPGHNVEFIKGGTPEGVEKFRSKISKDAQYKFDIPGIYAYWCTPHKGMGMIGFVIVGNDKSNLEAIKKIKYLGKSKKISEELIGSL